jgi:hypothetical protein
MRNGWERSYISEMPDATTTPALLIRIACGDACSEPMNRNWQITHGFSAVDAPAKNDGSIMLRKKTIIFVLVCLIAGRVMAQESKFTSLTSKDLRKSSGKEGLMITVDYAPGGSDAVIETMHTRLFTCWNAPS